VKRAVVQGPRRFRGSITVPGDKSITHRAVMLAGAARGESEIRHPLTGLDCRSTAAAVEALGARVKMKPKSWRVTGVGPHPFTEPMDILDCGNSGTSIRLLAGLVAGHPVTATFTGDESIRRRPMARVLGPLAEMGARIVGRKNDTLAPFTLRGGSLTGKAHTLTVASAQVKSAILLAGLGASGVTSVSEPHPSRDHTERMLLHFGAAITASPGRASVKGGAMLEARDVVVPGDLSSAAFFLVGALGAAGSELTLENVGVNATRAGLLDALDRMGARVKREGAQELSGEPVATLVVKGGATLRGTTVAGEEIPRLVDEVPILALAAAMAEGTTVISGASELRVKESDRIAAMAKLLAAFGARAEESPEGLAIHGGGALTPATISSGGDHRIAMTAAIAGCWAKGETVIDDVACVETSFPGFFQELERVTEPA